MARRYDPNPFDEEEEINPFADTGKSVPAASSRLSPLPPEPAGFRYDGGATVDIPLDTASTGGGYKDLKKKEKELQAKEAELRKREQDIKRREEAAAKAGIVLEEKNWPPFFPIIHHDIANDIPIHLQRQQYVAFATFLGITL
uniref:Secretory carrier-associated membrane protein n=1 Tax=Kalanchoe fedtschenkoi TaxID=63787 RepID=A0A7N0UW64_KALFE